MTKIRINLYYFN